MKTMIDNISYHKGYIMFDYSVWSNGKFIPTMYGVPAVIFHVDDYDVIEFTACGTVFNSVEISEDLLISVKHLWKEVDDELNIIEPLPDKKESLFEMLGRILKPNN